MDWIEEDEQQSNLDELSGKLKTVAEPKPEDHDEEVEDWEAELEEHMEGPKAHIQDWADL